MNRVLLLALAASTALGLSGCKIVYDDDKDETAIPAGPEGDDARNEARLEETFEPQLLPYVRDKAVEVSELRSQIAADIEAAGKSHAQRGSGAGAAWNFPVSGSGVVVQAKLDTRARTLGLDTDADGSADTTLQLGPVIKGTALRDGVPFYNFDDFRDQIEYAKLSRALNDRISAAITLPEGDPLGSTVSFLGVTPLRSATDALVVTPVEVTFRP
ncbi:DUF2291 family protein [Vannielia litorea]|uniref:DUF2291 family protein n=1 Tax=Vannielia litorea TaxID=1217970 RepID=UPI001C97A16B|nr:DUF2291 domain-containing protein [Vannielia litorea]MBY6049746.1 DUF2291 domain-containing protein [Vannielia litorea]MBY6077160.1 DUF2291 domain-containing protein [Vannielia litorea]